MQKELSLREWETEMVEFEAMDWEENGAVSNLMKIILKFW
jgi:hypothetical protein